MFFCCSKQLHKINSISIWYTIYKLLFLPWFVVLVLLSVKFNLNSLGSAQFKICILFFYLLQLVVMCCCCKHTVSVFKSLFMLFSWNIFSSQEVEVGWPTNVLVSPSGCHKRSHVKDCSYTKTPQARRLNCTWYVHILWGINILGQGTPT